MTLSRKLQILMMATLCGASTQASAEVMNNSRVKITAYYGMGKINPADLNNLGQNQGTTPTFNNINTSTQYGGTLGIRVHYFDIFAGYESMNAKNPVALTSPSTVANGGYEINENLVTAGIRAYLHAGERVSLYLLLEALSPTYSHISLVNQTKKEFDADKTLGERAELGIELKSARHFGFFLQGGYQSLVTGTVKDTTGAAQLNVNGGNLTVNLSGAVAEAGLSLRF